LLFVVVVENIVLAFIHVVISPSFQGHGIFVGISELYLFCDFYLLFGSISYLLSKFFKLFGADFTANFSYISFF